MTRDTVRFSIEAFMILHYNKDPLWNSIGSYFGFYILYACICVYIYNIHTYMQLSSEARNKGKA